LINLLRELTITPLVPAQEMKLVQELFPRTIVNETQATWNGPATGSIWQMAGASGANDRESTAIGSVTILNNEALNLEKQIVLSPGSIQEMVAGTFVNRGFLIRADTEQNDRFNYKTSDSVTSTQRSRFVIQYSLPSVISTNALTNTPHPTFTPSATPTTSRTPTPYFYAYQDRDGNVYADHTSNQHTCAIQYTACNECSFPHTTAIFTAPPASLTPTRTST
jgi:hypothetical protein